MGYHNQSTAGIRPRQDGIRTRIGVINAHGERQPRPRRRSGRAGGSQGIPIGAEQGRFTGIESPGAPRRSCRLRDTRATPLGTYLSRPLGWPRRDLRRGQAHPGGLPPVVGKAQYTHTIGIALCVTCGNVSWLIGCLGVFTRTVPDALSILRTCVMKRRNVIALRGALQRGVQDLATAPGPPLSFYAAGDTAVKTEPADGASGIPRRAIRRYRIRGVSLKGNKPVRAAETAASTAASTAAPAAAAPLASGFPAYGSLTQMIIPPPPRL